jgi:hypothetical protein
MIWQNASTINNVSKKRYLSMKQIAFLMGDSKTSFFDSCKKKLFAVWQNALEKIMISSK